MNNKSHKLVSTAMGQGLILLHNKPHGFADFPINTPERKAEFAAERLRGGSVDICKRAAMKMELDKAIQNLQKEIKHGVEFMPDDGYIRILSVTKYRGRGLYRKILDSRTFYKQKNGDYGWEAIRRAADKAAVIYRKFNDEKKQEEQKEKTRKKEYEKYRALLRKLKTAYPEHDLGNFGFSIHGVELKLVIDNEKDVRTILSALTKAGINIGNSKEPYNEDDYLQDTDEE